MKIYNPIKKILLSILFLLYAVNSNAGIGNDMTKFWDSLGGTSNITDPRFVKGQKAGHLSLGSIQMRSNIQTAQLASVRMPSLRAGCGGIDFYAGGFSFISSDELISLMKSIGSNAPGALAQLALDNISPKIGAIVKYFQNLAREINSLNINSCSAANSLIRNPGGVLNSAKTQGCRLYGLASNKFQDAAAANSACTSGGKGSDTVNSASDTIKDQYKLTDINIAWEALKKAGLVNLSSSDSVELAEVFMALSGTIIITGGGSDDSEVEINPYFPKIVEGKTINALLSGGVIQSKKCDTAANDNKCLSVSDVEINLDKKDSYLGRVTQSIKELADAIQNDSDSNLSPDVNKLLSFSPLPIYQIINIHTSYYRDTIELGSIAEFLALDILYGYLARVNKEVTKAAEKYNKDPHREVFKVFFDNQNQIREELNNKKRELSEKFENQMNVLQRTMSIRHYLTKSTNSKIKFGKK